MKRLTIVICLIFALTTVYARNYETSGTGMTGGVTLFDTYNPMIGLNNPSLLCDYHKLSIPVSAFFEDDSTGSGDLSDSSYNPRGLIPRYGFGRLFLANAYFGMSGSEDMIKGLSYYLPLINMANGGNTLGTDPNFPFNGTTVNMIQLFKTLSFGLVDLTPLFGPVTNTSEAVISNVIQMIMNNADSAGAYVFYNINLLSYYRNNFGFLIYASGDVMAGLFGEDRTALVINDPVVQVRSEEGLAVSVGHGERDLPLIGKAVIGSTFRLYALVEGKSESMLDALNLYKQLDAYMSAAEGASDWTDYLDFSAFGDGSLVRGGVGLAWDVAMTKKFNEYFSVAFKLSDLLSPVYWLNNSTLGWRAPDLSFGLKYTLPVDKKYWLLVHEPDLLFQIDDMLYTYPVSFLAKLHLGFRVKTLGDFLELGAGLNQGYPTLGFTLHITPAILAKIPVVKYLFFVTAPVTFFHVKYNFTIYGKELGTYPGDLGFQGYTTGVELYIGF